MFVVIKLHYEIDLLHLGEALRDRRRRELLLEDRVADTRDVSRLALAVALLGRDRLNLESLLLFLFLSSFSFCPLSLFVLFRLLLSFSFCPLSLSASFSLSVLFLFLSLSLALFLCLGPLFLFSLSLFLCLFLCHCLSILFLVSCFLCLSFFLCLYRYILSFSFALLLYLSYLPFLSLYLSEVVEVIGDLFRCLQVEAATRNALLLRNLNVLGLRRKEDQSRRRERGMEQEGGDREGERGERERKRMRTSLTRTETSPLVLSITTDLPERDQLVTSSFVIDLFFLSPA